MPAGDVRKHGAAGYRKGCKCSTCRAGHAEDARRYRARRKAGEPARVVEPPAPLISVPQPAPSAAAGPVQRALEAELRRLIGEPPWKNTLSALAVLNARLIDQAPALVRLDLVSPLQFRMLDVLDRLRAISAAPGKPRSTGDEAAAFLASLNDPDDAGTG